MNYKLINLCDKENKDVCESKDMDLICEIGISREEVYIILTCLENAIRVYGDSSEDYLIEMDEEDKEIQEQMIKTFKAIYKIIEELSGESLNSDITSSEKTLVFKCNYDMVEALVSAFDLYCEEMDDRNISKNDAAALMIYKSLQEIDSQILNKINPQYVKMLEEFKNIPDN